MLAKTAKQYHGEKKVIESPGKKGPNSEDYSFFNEKPTERF